MRKNLINANYVTRTLLLSCSILCSCVNGENLSQAPSEHAVTKERKARGPMEPLVKHIYTADPSAHVFKDKLYIYPSHDIDSGIEQTENGDHFDMRDYHVLSMDEVGGPVQDHGQALSVEDIPWASRQLWAPDAAHKDGVYYLYFPARDKNDIFRIGVASSLSPTGPFIAKDQPIAGSYSIDPSVFRDNGNYYMIFGGIWGGQLQKWRSGTFSPKDDYPADHEPALAPKIARLSDDMLQFAEPLRDVLIIDKKGQAITAGDNKRRFFEAAWIHKYKDTYYLSYSTGDTHLIVYATGDSPYGPFTYQGTILKPVLGWTNHHSIAKYQGKWYLFYHDSSLSKGITHLRSVKMVELTHNADGSITPIDALVKLPKRKPKPRPSAAKQILPTTVD